ncbi:MAG TPA: peroxiredoxin [Parvularculaceae bacterium]|nr:peroxiredoxin [Parvularculaceae bacterium]
MTLLLGQTVPDFTQDSTKGPIKFHEWIGDGWAVFFSHPKDFTPVCTTELGEVARLKPEWEKRHAKVIALSVDSVDDHKKWIKDIEETQKATIWYPILGDPDQKVSKLYGMIHPDAAANITVRSVFVIDPNKKLRLSITYPPSTGRDFREILRAIDSLQLTDNYKVATPVNWRDGEDVIIVPSLTDKDEIKKRFPKGYKEIKPYLRVTPQPNR